MSQSLILRKFGENTGDRAKWIGRATWGLFVLLVGFNLLKTIGKTEELQDGDFGAYYRAGSRVAHGKTPYSIDRYGASCAFVYSPSFAYLYSLPMSRLDYLWACRLWMLINWGLSLACIILALYLVVGDDGWARVSWGMVWLALLPMTSYYWSNVRNGQVGTLMVALCLGWAVCQRRGRSFTGGLLLAIAAAVKLAPGLLVPYLVVRRDWRGLAGCAAGGLALFLVPALWVGCDRSVDMHLEWVQFCTETQVPSQTGRVDNQSLLSLLARTSPISNGRVCYSYENLHVLERAYPIVLFVVAAILYASILWSRWKHSTHLQPNLERFRDNLHLALLLIFMTLLHPRAWSYNFVALALPCTMMADLVCRRSPGWKTALAPLVLTVLVCASWRSGGSGADWSLIGWFLQGKDFWAAMFLAAACSWSFGRQLRLPRLTVYPHPEENPLVVEERHRHAA